MRENQEPEGQPPSMQGSQIAHRRERCPQRSEKNGPSGTTVPTESITLGKGAKLPTVGSATQGRPYNLSVERTGYS